MSTDNPSTPDLSADSVFATPDSTRSGEEVPEPPAAPAQVCPACGEAGAADATWCEACGADFAGEHAAVDVDGPDCVDCGAGYDEIIDGYCSVCGRKQPAERDHLVEVVGEIAAVTDRGKRHHQNEDHMAIGRSGESLVVVVCDGVSTTDFPEQASLRASTAARDVLIEALDSGSIDIAAALAEATAAAQEQAAAVEEKPGGQGPASATFVATVLRPEPSDATVIRSWTAWLGDSRAYWVQEAPEAGDGESSVVVTQLTVDDVEGPSISRWLGADAGDTAPTIVEFEHDAGGRLLSCSDGLWKYVPEATELAELISRLEPEAESALDLAESLVAFANEQGGHDNTTVVIAST